MNPPVFQDRFCVTNRFAWLAFFIIILGFTIAKIPDLSIPYFWDEMGVYAPGSLHMKDHGISLMPASLNPYYSRGHPLLCYAIFGTAFKLFGDSVIAGHSFALFIAIATLLVTFLFAKEIFGNKTAVIAVLLTCVQPVFYTMSGIIMPEMLLTLFMTVSVWGMTTGRWWLYIAGSCLAVLTKEAGIIIPAAGLLFFFIESIIQKDFFTIKRAKIFLCLKLPIFVFIAFLIVQKDQNGWYFFPLHIGMTNHNPLTIIPRFFRLIKYPLFEQKRWPLGLSAIVGFVIVVLLPYKKSVQNKTIYLITLLFIIAMLFSAMNYFALRYIVFIIPFVVIAGVQFWVSFIENSWPKYQRFLLPVVVSMPFILAIVSVDPQKWNDNWDMAYKHQVFCQKTCINWAEKQPWHDSLVEANFPVFQALEDKRNGYLNGNIWPHSNGWQTRTSYGLFYHIDAHLPQIKADSFVILRQFHNCYATCSALKFYYKK